jgi:hypothetical protein
LENPAATKRGLCSSNGGCSFCYHLPYNRDYPVYETFEPQEAQRLASRLEIHHTPKHGSWLNMAEIELSVLKRQCLDRRIADMPAMTAEVLAWENNRNSGANVINWQFTTAEARIKLKRLYPKI